MPGHDEDDGASGPPPDPLDRIWLHPSEMRSLAPGGPPGVSRGGRVARWLWPLAAGAVAVGLITLVVVVALDGSGEGPVPTAVTGFGSDVGTARLIAAAGASVVTVQVAHPDGVTTASGVCVNRRSVLTSAHALDGATAITLITSDGRELPALSAGTDPETDLALLKTGPARLPVAPLGSSEQLREGHPVLALAAGSDEQQWVSVGTVNGFDELAVAPSGAVIAGLIDTATGAGRQHSGGAVLDARGEVVGILTVLPDASPSGLALPIELARRVANELGATGTARHAWLGVVGTDDKDRAGGGARVDQVTPASPAEKAGLEPGDVIVAVGDGSSTTSVSDMAELMGEVRRRMPGYQLELTIIREGGQRHVPVELGNKDAQTPPDAVATPTTVPTP